MFFRSSCSPGPLLHKAVPDLAAMLDRVQRALERIRQAGTVPTSAQVAELADAVADLEQIAAQEPRTGSTGTDSGE